MWLIYIYFLKWTIKWTISQKLIVNILGQNISFRKFVCKTWVFSAFKKQYFDTLYFEWQASYRKAIVKSSYWKIQKHILLLVHESYEPSL